MLILFKIGIVSIILLTRGIAVDCTYHFEKIYLNEQILTYYLDAFDQNNIQTQIDIFSYQIIPDGNDCSATITIEYTFKIYAPEIGINQYESFFIGEKTMDNVSTNQYLYNSDFSLVSGPTLVDIVQAKKLISYISQSGKLPNGKYLFQLVIKDDSEEVLNSISDAIEIKRPNSLELLSPGGTLSELSHSYVYSTVPLFSWYSDFCKQCIYGIRVCEFKQDEHASLQDALTDWSILPYVQSSEYHEILWNSRSFQYPTEGHIDLDEGKFYVWQIRQSYETTFDVHHDYSPIYIFEVRSPTKIQLEYNDPYLSVIQTLIGKEQFNLWFSAGGELERYVTTGESIWINGEEIHIDALYALVSELNQGEITLEKIQLK